MKEFFTTISKYSYWASKKKRIMVDNDDNEDFDSTSDPIETARTNNSSSMAVVAVRRKLTASFCALQLKNVIDAKVVRLGSIAAQRHLLVIYIQHQRSKRSQISLYESNGAKWFNATPSCKL